MLVIFCIINILLCFSLFLLKARQNSPFMIFYLVIAAVFLIPTIFDRPGNLIQFHNFAPSIYLDFNNLGAAHLFTFITLLSFLVLELRFPLRHCINLNAKVSQLTCIAPPLAVTFMFIVTYLIYGPYLLFASFASVRAGDFGIIPLFLTYLSILSIPSAALSLDQRRYLYFLFALAPLTLPVVILGGARQTLAISLFAIAFVVMRKFRFKYWFLFLFVAAFLPFADWALAISKHVRNLPDFDARLAFLSGDIFNWESQRGYGEGGLRFFYYLIAGGVKIESSGQLEYLARTILVWLPSSFDILSIKPDDFEYKVFSAVMGGRSGTMHPTFFGIILADARWLFLLWVFLVFRIMRAVENMLAKHEIGRNYMFFFCFYVSVMWARGSIYAPTLLLFIALLLRWAIASVIRLRNQKELTSL